MEDFLHLLDVDLFGLGVDWSSDDISDPKSDDVDDKFVLLLGYGSDVDDLYLTSVEGFFSERLLQHCLKVLLFR